MARYAIEALGFTCVDRPRVDIFGSDRARWFFTWTNGRAPTTVVSRGFRDLDADGVRHWVPSFRITPVGGVPGPLALSVQLYLVDDFDDELLRAAIERALTAAGLASMASLGGPVSIPLSAVKQLAYPKPHELVGSVTDAFSRTSLADWLRNPGDGLVRNLIIGGRRGDPRGVIPDGPAYSVMLRVVRETEGIVD